MKYAYYFLTINIYIIIPFFSWGGFMALITRRSDRNFQRTFGWKSVVVTGAIGTPIHELSHLIVAVLWGFKITHIKLFSPIEGKKTGILGYVNYKYRSTFWGRFGQFFVGIAPMFGGSAVIYGLFILLVPELKTLLFTHIGSIEQIQDVRHIFEISYQLNHFFGIRFIVFLVLQIMISSHMTISKADLKNALYGGTYLEIALLIFSFCLGFLEININQIIISIIKGLWIMIVVGMMSALVTLMVSEIMTKR